MTLLRLTEAVTRVRADCILLDQRSTALGVGTFWMPARGQPRFELERLALAVFE